MGYGRDKQIPVVIDIETLREPLSSAAIAKFEREYKPHSTYKSPAATAKHKAGKYVEYDNKTAFRFDRQRPISVAVADVGASGLGDIAGFASPDSRDVAKWLAEWLRELGGAFCFVCFNGEAFDLPILARWTALAGERWPYKIGKWDTIDLFQRPFNRSIGLKEAAAAYGFDPGTTSGGDVAGLAERGKFDEILTYNKHDVEITGGLYLKLKGMYDM
jgi:hypothetical protein